jgi:multiple sugar transport system permease protein
MADIERLQPTRMERLKPYLIILPALLLTVGILIPFGTGVFWSFTNYNLMRPNFQFTGLRNYIQMFQSEQFWNAIRVSGTYVFFAVGTELLLGLGIGLLLNRDNVVTAIFRPLLILPLLIAPVIAVLMWRLMMSTQFGVLNYFMTFFDPALKNFPWAGVAEYAMFTVVLIDVWIFTPFIALLVLAGLRSLPRAPFEAAQVDGASKFYTFRTQTMPMLMPYITIALIFRLIDSFRIFDIPFALTKGGPGDSLMTLQVTAYTQSFTYLNIGRGAAYMFLTWIIIYMVSKFLVNHWMKWRAKLS